MVIWDRCIRLKLTFSHGKLTAHFFLVKAAVKYRNLQISKILNTDITEFFQHLSRLCTYLWGIHSLNNNSAVKRSGYLYVVNQKYSLVNVFFFLIKSITRSFMLNIMMENENNRFANISIPFVILFIYFVFIYFYVLFTYFLFLITKKESKNKKLPSK